MKKLFIVLFILLFAVPCHAGLMDRLFPDDPEDENIAIHTFRAAIGEYSAGAVTRNQIKNALNLTGNEATQFDSICDVVDTLSGAGLNNYLITLHDVLLLVEDGFYNKSQAESRLGL